MPDSHRSIVAVAALIFREGKVLAMRRSATKDAAPGLWETLSGRVNPGEEPLDAIVREIQEECGLTVRLDPRPVTAYAAKRLDSDMVVIVYRADWLDGEVVRSEEHDAHAWLTPQEFAAIGAPAKLAEAVHLASHGPDRRAGEARRGGPPRQPRAGPRPFPPSTGCPIMTP